MQSVTVAHWAYTAQYLGLSHATTICHPHHIRLNSEAMIPAGSWTQFLWKRPIHRLLAICGVFAVILFFYFPFGSSRQMPYHLGYDFQSGSRPQQYPSLRPYPPPLRPDPNSLIMSNLWEERAHQVREAFRYAWEGYQNHAVGWDELTPVDGGKVNK